MYQKCVVLVEASRCQLAVVHRVKPDELPSVMARHVKVVELRASPRDLNSTFRSILFSILTTSDASHR